MVQMMPEFLPYKIQLVYFTGVLEMALAAGLMFPRYSKWTSIALILFFLAILPANIIGSIKEYTLGEWRMDRAICILGYRSNFS